MPLKVYIATSQLQKLRLRCTSCHNVCFHCYPATLLVGLPCKVRTCISLIPLKSHETRLMQGAPRRLPQPPMARAPLYDMGGRGMGGRRGRGRGRGGLQRIADRRPPPGTPGVSSGERVRTQALAEEHVIDYSFADHSSVEQRNLSDSMLISRKEKSARQHAHLRSLRPSPVQCSAFFVAHGL